MITMVMMGRIRSMHLRQSKSISEIARLTSLACNTIKKWLKAPQAAEPKYRRREMPTKLASFVEALDKALKADGHRPRHEWRTARALHVELQALGYDGGCTRLTAYIRSWRGEQCKISATSALVPLSFELGDAFQFDWSEEGLVIGGIYRRIQLAHLKLCASRAFWLAAYPTQGHEMLFDAHTRSFAALGGIPRRGVYDLHVDGRRQGQEGQGPRGQRTLRGDERAHLFDPDFCNVASGWEKGRVEKNVQDSRRRVWIEESKPRSGAPGTRQNRGGSPRPKRLEPVLGAG
jgi:transposase